VATRKRPGWRFSALPTALSLRPSEYTSAVSTKVMPPLSVEVRLQWARIEADRDRLLAGPGILHLDTLDRQQLAVQDGVQVNAINHGGASCEPS